MYNESPTLGEADELFVDRDATFSKLAPLLARYQFQFGVYLVHAHCKLEQGERMVAINNISQPASDSKPCYPDRWLSNGKPFEFRRDSVPSPPPELIAAFGDIVGVSGVLGLFYAGDMAPGEMLLERTEGRVNITERISALPSEGGEQIETAWLPDGSDKVVKMACTIWCDSRTTRTGSVHKGTRSHIKS